MSKPWRDPRSRELHDGRLQLFGEDKKALRLEVFRRAEGRCEEMHNGERCGRWAPWDGFGHGELSHRNHGIRRNDTLKSCLWSCRECHRQRHPGPQWSEHFRRSA